MGTALAGQGQIDAAIRHYQTALKSDPYNPEAHNNLGVLLAQKNMLPEALEHFKRALALRPGYASAINNLRRLEQIHQ
jgi:Flp pilus assembly protein TadD